MKHMLLLGDSIRLSYREHVQTLLDGEVQVHGPRDNCRFSTHTLFYLNAWLGDRDYDLIQWNNGQWDTCHMPDGRILVPLESYLEQQARIAGILRSRTSRLVFATTTPVKGDLFATNRPNPRCNEDIATYNQAAARRLAHFGVQILDLYQPVLDDIDRCIGDDRVHLTPHGTRLCAQLVADSVRRKIC